MIANEKPKIQKSIFAMRRLIVVLSAIVLFLNVNFVAAQTSSKTPPKVKETAEEIAAKLAAAEALIKANIAFEPDFEDDDLSATRERAWEYRPYMVAVWFCLDGSPELDSSYKNIVRDVTRRSELMDPCGWDLTTGLAPSRWRNQLRRHIESPKSIPDVEHLSRLDAYDKLIIVCLDIDSGVTNLRAREYDVQTQLWGPMVIREVQQKQQLGNHIMQAISVAFMPIARIDRIQDYLYTDSAGKDRKKDEVVMRLRAISSCIRATSVDQLHPKIEESEEGAIPELVDFPPMPIEESPVYVKDEDRFLPIIRRTDRLGNLVKLEPIDFTYLTVREQDPEQAEVRCLIESAQRAPLSQRKSKRAQKLALVIRPPQRSTKLFLVSQDKARTPLEGFDVVAKRPDQPVGSPNEYIGKTDWQGSIDIPPSAEGLRIVLIRRGTRGLRRLPIMPGLYDSVTTSLPNDETRLYAEGVVRGLQNEVLSLVIRRKVLEGEIEGALKKENISRSRDLFEEYRDLETPQDIKERMTTELVSLKTQTADKKELEYINKMFETLRKIVSSQQKESKEMEITKRIQDLVSAKSTGNSN